MFQAFVVLCLIGQEPSFDNCKVSLQPAIQPSETICMNSIANFLDIIAKGNILEKYEIHDIGCHSYLTEDKLKT